MSNKINTFDLVWQWASRALLICISIIGFFLSSTINTFASDQTKFEDRLQFLEKRVERIEERQTQQYDLILKQLDIVTKNQDRFIQKFEQYDKEAKEFYKTYDLKKKEN